MYIYIYIKFLKFLAAKHYQEINYKKRLPEKAIKKRLQQKARERYKRYKKKKKEKKRQYGRERYKNLSEDEKNLVEYREKYRMRKNAFTITRKYFDLENFASLQGKYEKLFSFVLIFK